MAPRVPWAVLYDAERFHARGRALRAWEDAGGDVDRLVALDRAIRRARYTDFPGRPETTAEVRWGPDDGH